MLKPTRAVFSNTGGAGCENTGKTVRPSLRIGPPNPINQRFRNGKAPLSWGLVRLLWCFQHLPKLYHPAPAGNLTALKFVGLEYSQFMVLLASSPCCVSASSYLLHSASCCRGGGVAFATLQPRHAIRLVTALVTTFGNPSGCQRQQAETVATYWLLVATGNLCIVLPMV